MGNDLGLDRLQIDGVRPVEHRTEQIGALVDPPLGQGSVVEAGAGIDPDADEKEKDGLIMWK
jgi:hypothetical protein